MFLTGLSEIQKKSFVKLAYDLIAADDIVRKEEENILKLLQLEMGLTNLEDSLVLSYNDAIKSFKCKKSQTYALIELLGIAHVDGEYAESEKVYIRNLAKIFKIGEVELASIENWVLRLIAMMNEVEEFWEED